MEFFETVKNRFSYRDKCLDIKIPREDLKKIVQAGLDAPSGMNMQTTDIVVVDDPQILSQIASFIPERKILQTAKAMILAIIDKNPKPIYKDYSFQIEDCSAAVQNMLLAITALGYGSVWLDGVLRVNDNNIKIGKLLDVPDSKIIQILLPVGKMANEAARREKLPFENRVSFNRYNIDKL